MENKLIYSLRFMFIAYNNLLQNYQASSLGHILGHIYTIIAVRSLFHTWAPDCPYHLHAGLPSGSHMEKMNSLPPRGHKIPKSQLQGHKTLYHLVGQTFLPEAVRVYFPSRPQIV